MRKRSVALSITSMVLLLGLASCNSSLDNPAKGLSLTQEASKPMVTRTPQPIMEDDVAPTAAPVLAPAEVTPPPVAEVPASLPDPEPKPAAATVVQAPEPVAVPEVAPPVVAPVPVPAAPPAPAPVAAAPVQQEIVKPAAPPAPVVTRIYVGLAGGQGEVDKCRGPVWFTPVTQTTMVVEHDGCGGWARFGSMPAGEIVSLSGTVSGTYKIGGQMVVNKFANSNVIPAGFGGIYPPLLFQTCIPGTNQMVLTAAYPV